MSLTPSTPPDAVPEQLVAAPNDKFSELFSLDVLRGFALFGILVISIWEFGGFTNNEQLVYHNGTHGGNYKLMTAVSLLFEGKMLSLLALVFGAGVLLFLQKKEHPVAISSADAHIRRMMWLMAFGVFNAFILLWPGDVLFPYGVMGILLFAFTRMRAKGFFIAAIVCTLIYCGKQYWNYTDDKKDYKKYTAVMAVEKKFKADSSSRAKKDSIDRTKDTVLLKDTLLKNKLNDSLAKKNDTLTKKQAEEKGTWEGTVKSLKYDTATAKAANKSIRAKWSKVAYSLMARSQQKESSWLYRIGIWDIGSLMFLGMALLSIGFFGSRFATSKYLVIALIAIVAGLALAWFRVNLQCSKLADYAKYIEKKPIPYNQFFPIERILMTTSYASLILWLLRMKVFNWIWKAFAAVGRMALTNYILQTIICTFFFYGYGFGYFGRLQQWELYFMVAEIILVQVVFSVFWLRNYSRGPLEWLWQCLVYREWLPNKKPSDETLQPD
jgi:uncharacterized protein